MTEVKTIDELYKYDKVIVKRYKKYNECTYKYGDCCMCEMHFYTITNQSFLEDAFNNLQYCNNIKELYLTDLGLKDDTNIEFPSLLEWLDISNNKFTKLPKIPDSVKILVCSRNKLLSIDLPITNKIERLFCRQNKITTLDNLTGNIWELDCSSNMISTLNNLPNSIRHLNCMHNNIHNLDNLPYGITCLHCSINPIKSLTNLPNNITWLTCNNCLLENIDNLPYNLDILDCENNKILKILNIPTKMRIINYRGNPCYNDEETKKLIDEITKLNKT